MFVRKPVFVSSSITSDGHICWSKTIFVINFEPPGDKQRHSTLSGIDLLLNQQLWFYNSVVKSAEPQLQLSKMRQNRKDYGTSEITVSFCDSNVSVVNYV